MSSACPCNEAAPAAWGPWGGLPAGSHAAAAWLRQHTTSSQQAVAVCAAPQPALAALVAGALIAGRPLLLCAPGEPPARLQQRLHLVQQHFQVVAWLGENGPGQIPDYPLRTAIAHDLPALSDGDGNGDGDDNPPCWLVFGSGSSGGQRAIIHRRRNLLAAARSQAQHLDLNQHSQWLSCLPMEHIGGLMALLRIAAAGGCLHLLARFEASAVANALHRVDGASLVPTMVNRLLAASNDQWPRGPRLLIGGAGIDSPTLTALRKRGPQPLRCWGASESAAMVTCQDSAAAEGEDVGRPLPGVEIRRDEHGQLALRSPALASEALASDGIVSLCDAEGWWLSGDAGSCDEAGRWTIHGRLDGAVHSGGETIFPEQVERALSTCPGVSACAVLAISDPEWGHSLGAAVVGSATTDALIAWSRAHLAAAERPKRWLQLPQLPLLANGKIDRQHLAQGLGAVPSE